MKRTRLLWQWMAVLALTSGIHTTALQSVALAGESDSSVTTLARKLEQGPDFRIRVQAALELGKTNSRRDEARAALEMGLEDVNAAVRAACAAALRVLADPAALPALRRAQEDESSAVKAQIAGTIAALEQKANGDSGSNAGRGRGQVLVQVGQVRNATKREVGGLVQEFKTHSKERLQSLPGVELLHEQEDADAAAKRRKQPVVMLTGHLRQLDERQRGGEMEYAAEVEFIIHRMPGRSIQGKVSGSARVRSGLTEVKSPKQQAELRRNVIEAAIDSAMKRAAEALLAAAK
jgi:hypothetical protein